MAGNLHVLWLARETGFAKNVDRLVIIQVYVIHKNLFVIINNYVLCLTDSLIAFLTVTSRSFSLGRVNG